MVSAFKSNKEWKKFKLGEVVTLATGKLNSNAAVSDGQYPFFTCAQEIYKINSYAFDQECVLLGGNNANGIYPLFYFKGKFNAYQRTYILSIKDNAILNYRFLYFLLRQKLEELRTSSTGAATKFLTLNIINPLEISIPGVTEQKKIADILSAYDDLIEVNNKKIKILEEIAQTIYKEWFVKPTKNGLHAGWEFKTLGDQVEIKKGKNITKNTINEGNIPVVAGGLSPAYYHDIANTLAPVITISASGANAGYVNLYYEDIWASDCSFIDQKATQYPYFYYLFLKDNQTEITRSQRGSAQPHVYPIDLMRLTIAVAPKKILDQIEKKIESTFNIVSILKKQNQNLRETRDLLLKMIFRS